MSSSDFLTPAQKPKEFLYYFGTLDIWPHLRSDFSPVKPFFLSVEGTNFTSSANIFIGHAGVTAQAHYDRSSNYFVQVYGRKRWILAPPSQSECMYFYPYIHPHYQQSAIDWDSPNDTFTKFKNTILYEANLEPGDVLYIPRNTFSVSFIWIFKNKY